MGNRAFTLPDNLGGTTGANGFSLLHNDSKNALDDHPVTFYAPELPAETLLDVSAIMHFAADFHQRQMDAADGVATLLQVLKFTILSIFTHNENTARTQRDTGKAQLCCCPHRLYFGGRRSPLRSTLSFNVSQ